MGPCATGRHRTPDLLHTQCGVEIGLQSHAGAQAQQSREAA